MTREELTRETGPKMGMFFSYAVGWMDGWIYDFFSCLTKEDQRER